MPWCAYQSSLARNSLQSLSSSSACASARMRGRATARSAFAGERRCGERCCRACTGSSGPYLARRQHHRAERPDGAASDLLPVTVLHSGVDATQQVVRVLSTGWHACSDIRLASAQCVCGAARTASTLCTIVRLDCDVWYAAAASASSWSRCQRLVPSMLMRRVSSSSLHGGARPPA